MKEVRPTVQSASPEQLISGAAAALRQNGATDAELLDIIVDNVAKLAPSATAVSDAADAIEALASKRAEEAGDDSTDHD